MVKAVTPVLLGLLTALALSASAGGTQTAVPSARIIGASHTHPEGATISFVCAKVRKSVRRGFAALSVRGPGANVPGRRYSKLLKGRFTKIFSFQISAPGTYIFKLTFRKKTTTKKYTVPAPDPAVGPFRCP